MDAARPRPGFFRTSLGCQFQDRPGLDLALTALRSLGSDLREGGPLGPVVWLGVSSALRVMLLPHQGVFFRPVPFA